MHKNHKFTNKNTHKLNMQAERDIPCERETESETATENEADREIERQNEREIARLINLVCGYVLLCCGLGMLCSVVVGKRCKRWF